MTTADLYAELAFQTIVRAGMWRTVPDASSSTAGSGGRSSCAADTAARTKALIARCYASHDKSPELASEAAESPNALGDPALRSYGYDVLG